MRVNLWPEGTKKSGFSHSSPNLYQKRSPRDGTGQDWSWQMDPLAFKRRQLSSEHVK